MRRKKYDIMSSSHKPVIIGILIDRTRPDKNCNILIAGYDP